MSSNKDNNGEEARNRQACAPCKHQRKRCKETCVLAPYFPATMQQKFQAAHKIFGVKNMQKMLQRLQLPDRQLAVQSILWEAALWEQDPVQGPLGQYKKMEQKIKALEKEQKQFKQYFLMETPGLNQSDKGNGINSVVPDPVDHEDSMDFIHSNGNLDFESAVKIQGQETGHQTMNGPATSHQIIPQIQGNGARQGTDCLVGAYQNLEQGQERTQRRGQAAFFCSLEPETGNQFGDSNNNIQVHYQDQRGNQGTAHAYGCLEKDRGGLFGDAIVPVRYQERSEESCQGEVWTAVRASLEQDRGSQLGNILVPIHCQGAGIGQGGGHAAVNPCLGNVHGGSSTDGALVTEEDGVIHGRDGGCATIYPALLQVQDSVGQETDPFITLQQSLMDVTKVHNNNIPGGH